MKAETKNNISETLLIELLNYVPQTDLKYCVAQLTPGIDDSDLKEFFAKTAVSLANRPDASKYIYGIKRSLNFAVSFAKRTKFQPYSFDDCQKIFKLFMDNRVYDNATIRKLFRLTKEVTSDQYVLLGDDATLYYDVIKYYHPEVKTERAELYNDVADTNAEDILRHSYNNSAILTKTTPAQFNQYLSSFSFSKILQSRKLKQFLENNPQYVGTMAEHSASSVTQYNSMYTNYRSYLEFLTTKFNPKTDNLEKLLVYPNYAFSYGLMIRRVTKKDYAGKFNKSFIQITGYDNILKFLNDNGIYDILVKRNFINNDEAKILKHNVDKILNGTVENKELRPSSKWAQYGNGTPVVGLIIDDAPDNLLDPNDFAEITYGKIFADIFNRKDPENLLKEIYLKDLTSCLALYR